MHEIELKGKEGSSSSFGVGWESGGIGSKAVEKCRSGEQRRIVLAVERWRGEEQ